MLKSAPRLVLHHVGVRFRDALAVGHELEHGLLALDGAFFAGETGDVSGRAPVRALGVDEGAFALVRAEVTGRAVVRSARVGQVDRGVDADEGRHAAPFDDPERLEGRADRPGLTRMRVYEDLGPGDSLQDVVDLCLDRRQIVLRAALQHEPFAQRGHARNLDDVLPHILGQDLRESGEQLLFREALFLEVDPVRVQEHGAAVTELGGQLGREGGLRVGRDRQAELVGHGLEQHAVAGGAGVGEPEVGDVAVLHEQDLDVLPADVADDIDITEIAHRRHHVRDGLDDVHVGQHALLKNIGGVTGRPEPDDLQSGPVGLDLASQALEELLGVQNRVALGELIGLADDVALFVHEDGLRGRRAAIQADDRADHLAGRELRRHEPGDRIGRAEDREFVRRPHQGRARGLAQPGLAAVQHVVPQPFEPCVSTDLGALGEAIDAGAERGVVLGILRDEDGLLDGAVPRPVEVPLFPDLGDSQTPAGLKKRQKRVRAAEEQDARLQGRAARQHGQVLQHDGIGQRAENLLRVHAALHEVDDVGLGEDATFRRHVVEFAGVEGDLADLLGREPHLEHALVDGRARPRGALVVHRRVGRLPAVGPLLEHDDLGVLPAELDHRSDVRMQVLYGEGDRVDLLDELRPDALAQGQGARAGQEDPPRASIRVRESRLDLHQHLEDLLGLFRLVALVVAEEDLERSRVEGDDLDGRRADVDTEDERFCVRKSGQRHERLLMAENRH